MANISTIFGGAFMPPTERILEPPEIQFADAMQEAGFTPPEQIIMDGKIHRFSTGGKRDKSAWYILFGGDVPAGTYGDWRGDTYHFKADIGRRLTDAEQMIHTRRMAEAKAIRDAELAKTREVASSVVDQIWSEGKHAEEYHPYLKRKGIKPNGARVTGDGRLMLPLLNADGELSSLQYIADDGDKKYHPGGATGGMFWTLGSLENASRIYIAEGYATAATIHEVTNAPVIIAYSASNLVPVTGSFRELLGAQADIVIVADHDASGVGMRYAEQASAKYGVRVVVPPELGDANDYHQAGHDLALLLNPPKDEWLISADDFSAQPAPIKWLIKQWLQQDALIMVHGPSGGGKTFVVLDACMRIASGLEIWANKHKVKKGSVVYLAGEGHHGLRSRIAAWKHYYSIKKMNMWLSKGGCDLNTPDGYHKVIDHIRNLPETPVLIVVDTLHRFLMGDENSSQDAKTMLDACAGIMREFKGASVLLVHHTGVSEDSQHRARGSSAWKGALEIEISVVPAKDNQPIEVIQRKTKDAEEADNLYFNLEKVEIPGWFDEDGEPVSSAVLVPANKEDAPRESIHNQHKKRFERAWFSTGCERLGGNPFVSKSALIHFLEINDGINNKKAEEMCKTDNDKFIGVLVNSGAIRYASYGFEVTDDVWISAMCMK